MNLNKNLVSRKQRVIIYDSVDKVGKTEMAMELSRRIGVPYFKNAAEHTHFLNNPGYFRDAVRYVDTYFTAYLETTGASVILDRAWPAEWVYSRALGRPTDDRVLEELDRRHAALGTRIVIPYRNDYSKCVDDYEVINKNFQRISDLYEEFALWSKCKCLLLNVDDEDIEREMKETLEFLEDYR